jgi:transcriptional regulator with XRE-family HTH domain
MNDDKIAQQLEKSRAYVARKVQDLRKERRWTQAELSRRLHLSQSRLSEIERGAGSFTAEQFLEILKLFNVSVTDFAPAPQGEGSELQNSLARLGALHLQESTELLPSERLSNVSDVIREAIVASEFPRLITALAPVLVRNIDRINLKRLHLQLADAGLERRLAWLVENTLEALRRERPGLAPAPWRRFYNRARVVLESFLDSLSSGSRDQVSAPDVLDTGIRSKETLADVAASSSPLSQRWGIVTTLQPDDFVAALRGARAAGR